MTTRPVTMYRAFVAIGVIIDLLMVSLLIIVSGWIIDSWHDRDPWAGPVVTTFWAAALILSAGGPILAYVLRRRAAPPERIVLAVWGPRLMLVGLRVIGFVVFTPNE
jgi:hypothetical protein